MQSTTAEGVILQKTRELCQTIIEQPEFQQIRRSIDEFMADESTRTQFQSVNEKGGHLHHKQQQGVNLSADEIADFERDRDALLRNPVARAFLDAQEEMHKMQESVGQFVAKTFELGRVPAEEDLQEGSCEHGGCGCSH